MDPPFDDSNHSNSLDDVLAALSKLETVTEAMVMEELDGDLADLIRTDRVQIFQPPLSDVNNNTISSTISNSTHHEVQTSEQEQMRLFLRTPQFLPSFESFQRSVKQASVEGFAPKDLMNIPIISNSFEGQYKKSDVSLISTPPTVQRLKEKYQLVNIHQRQFSGGSGQVKGHFPDPVEMSRPGTPWISPSTYQGHHSSKVQSRLVPPLENTSTFPSQSYKVPYFPTTVIPQIPISTPAVGPLSSSKETTSKQYTQYDHSNAKEKYPNETYKINSRNISSTSSAYHDSNRPTTPWVGSTIQKNQSKQMLPYHYENKTKMYRSYPNQPYRGSAHSASTSNLVNALRGNSTQTIPHQNFASANSMKYPKRLNQEKGYLYKKPYSQAERVTNSPKEVELRKRLAAPNIYSAQGSNSSKMLHVSTKKLQIQNSTMTSLNKSLPRGYTHMTASSKSRTEYKTMASYIDLTDGTTLNHTGYYKLQTEKSNDIVVKTEKQEMEQTVIDSEINKPFGTELNYGRMKTIHYNDQTLGFDRSQHIKIEMKSNNDNSRYTSYQPNLQSATSTTSIAPNQDIENTGVEQNNMEAVKNLIFGNVAKQRRHYSRLIRNMTDENYSNYAHQHDSNEYDPIEGPNYNDTYQHYASQSNASGYVPNGSSWNYCYDRSNANDQSQSFPDYSSWDPNISGWYQQNNDFMYNSSSAFQQANQIITTNNSIFPVHQENNLHMNIYNFNNLQGYPHQEAWAGQTQQTPNHEAKGATQNNVNGVESSMLILNRDILDLDEHQKQQRNLLIKIGLTRAIYNDQNSTEEEKRRRMADLLDSVLATPDGTHIVRDIIEEQCRRVGYDRNNTLESRTGKKEE